MRSNGIRTAIGRLSEFTQALVRIGAWVALLGLVVLSATGTARADNFAYITAANGIWAWDTTTNTTSLVTTAVSTLDSLVFDNNGNIVYSVIGTNQLGLYNTTTHVNSIIANVGSGAADLALEPSGNSVLVSDAFTTFISRVNLTTSAVTSFNVGVRPDGLTYDSSGDLFAVLNRNSVVQLDPTTFAVIKTISGLVQADGLTFDPTTGKLYVSSDQGSGGYYTVDTALTTATFTNLGIDIDGLSASGNTLYLVRRGIDGVQVDLTTNSITQNSPGIADADDIAPLTGLGSPNVPEPASVVLLGTLMAGLVFAIRRKSRAI